MNTIRDAYAYEARRFAEAAREIASKAESEHRPMTDGERRAVRECLSRFEDFKAKIEEIDAAKTQKEQESSAHRSLVGVLDVLDPYDPLQDKLDKLDLEAL